MTSLNFSKNGLTDEVFLLFQKLLLEKTGLYFQRGRKHQIETGLAGRLHAREMASYEAYFDFLKNAPESAEEIQVLIDTLTIQETSFFRNQPHFNVFKNYIIPYFLHKRSEGNPFIRIWSAGCSTGQEIYSIAILLREFLPEFHTWNISLLATDISQPALNTARRGVYHRKFFESVPYAYQSKYFRAYGGNEIEISDQIRKMVNIEQHNLAIDSYNRKGMKALDVIFCKNVTIYFNESTTRRIIEGFYQCLSYGSYLFIGHSETLWKISEKFQAVEFPDTFVYRKGDADAFKPNTEVGKKRSLSKIDVLGKYPDYTPDKSVHNPKKQSFVKAVNSDKIREDKVPSEKEVFATAMQAAKFKKYNKAISIFVQFKPGSPYFDQARVAHATLLSNQGKYDEAMLKLNEILIDNNLSEEAYYLLGILKNRTQEYEEAVKMFQKALYVNPKNILAVFYLGEVYRETNQNALAKKTYQNVLKILKELPSDQALSLFEEFTPDLLGQACAKRLDALEIHS